MLLSVNSPALDSRCFERQIHSTELKTAIYSNMEYFVRSKKSAPDLFECPEFTCPDPNVAQSLGGSNCFWDESLFDCFQDFSGQSQAKNDGDYRSSEAPADYLYNFSEGAEEEGYGSHAALHYEDLEDAGPPSSPQPFPMPCIHEGTRTTVMAMDHRTGSLRKVKHVLMAASNVTHSSLTQNKNLDRAFLPVEQQAYLMKKKISKSKYGNDYLGVVLKRRERLKCNTSFNENEKEEQEDASDVEWQSTNEFVIICVSPWSSAMGQMGKHGSSLCRKRDTVVHAIAAQQHVGAYHPHVQGLLYAFQDSEHLYCVTKFHGVTSLQSKILARRDQGVFVPDEAQARVVFSQLLQGIFHLQRKGVYHSNLSLENVFLDSINQNLLITDFGRCLRVPYNDPSNFGCINSEAEGSTRRLLQLQSQDFQNHPSENLIFLPPEILENVDSFDGFAADVWAAGSILFILLVGMAPFNTSHYWDAAYAEISSGNIKGLLQSSNITLSDEAVHLLQNMFWRDPRERLTLAQITDHSWVKNERFSEARQVSPTATRSVTRNSDSKHLSSDDTVSSTSSFSVDKNNQGRRSSSGSRKSFAKTITNMFGGGANSKNISSISKAFSGMMSSSNRSNGSSSRRTHRTSVGELSSAASSATSVSPIPVSSNPFVEGTSESSYDLGVLQIPAI